MKYVLDSSVALKWVLPEPLSDKARQLRDDYRHLIHELLAPDIFPAESAHALARAERRKIIALGDAAKLFGDLMMTAPQFHPYRHLLSRALAIASPMRIGVYDCLYVALAEREKCELVTADDRLVKNLQAKFPFILHLNTFPP
jgi:predicted nucleic acid-binding protein